MGFGRDIGVVVMVFGYVWIIVGVTKQSFLKGHAIAFKCHFSCEKVVLGFDTSPIKVYSQSTYQYFLLALVVSTL